MLPFVGKLLFISEIAEFPEEIAGCCVVEFDDVIGVFVGIGWALSCAGVEGMLVGTSFDITGSGVMDGALLVSTGAEEKEGAMVIFGVSFGSDVIDASGVDGILLGSIESGVKEGDSVILGVLVTVIVQVAVALLLSAEEAVIVTIPGLAAVTVPELSTVAIDSSELIHIIDGSVASAGRMVDTRVRDLFGCNVAVVLSNVTELT